MDWKVILEGYVLLRTAACTLLVAALFAGMPASAGPGCKRDAGALLVDIRSGSANVALTGAAAHVPYSVDDAARTDMVFFRQEFRQEMDGLARDHCGHDSPVVLIAASPALGEMAVANLREHGFERVYFVTERESSVAIAAH